MSPATMRIWWLVLPAAILVVWAAGVGRDGAGELGTVDASDEPPAAAAPVSTDRTAEIIDRLTDTAWTIELQPMYGDELDHPMTDILEFQWKSMTSSMFAATGYAPLNFTLDFDDEGIPVWESTQFNPQKGLVLWRGQLHGQTMRGVVSTQPIEGHSQDYIFVGQETQDETVAVPLTDAAPDTDSTARGAVESDAADDGVEKHAVVEREVVGREIVDRQVVGREAVDRAGAEAAPEADADAVPDDAVPAEPAAAPEETSGVEEAAVTPEPESEDTEPASEPEPVSQPEPSFDSAQDGPLSEVEGEPAPTLRLEE